VLAALAPSAATTGGCALTGAGAANDDLDRIMGRGPDPAPPPAPGRTNDLRSIEAAVASSRPGGAEETPAPFAGPLDVGTAIALAEETLESLRIRGEDLHRAHLARLEALSRVLPTVTWRYAYTRSEPDVSAPPGVRFGGLLTENRTSRFELRQPLFRGEDWGALAAAGPFVEAAEARVRDERRIVRIATVRAFTAALSADRVARTFEAALRRDDERLKEARDRAQVGMIRRTEVLFIETDRARAESVLVRANEDVEAARARLALVVGRPIAGTLMDLAEAPPPPAVADPLVARALEQRQDIEAARRDAETLRLAIYAAWGRFLPGVDFVGNLYTHREGTLEDVDWDIGVDVVVPIFEGLSSGARLRDAEAQHRTAQLRYEALARSVAEEVTRLWHDRRASRAAITSQRVGLAAADENRRLLEAEFRAGVATNIELITAEQALRQAQLDVEIETLNERRLAIEMSLATGGEP